jgi:hypothetical protein
LLLPQQDFPSSVITPSIHYLICSNVWLGFQCNQTQAS